MRKNLPLSIIILSLLSGCTTLDKAILGMPLDRTITPEYVKNYKTPQDLINGENLNGDDEYSVYYGKAYRSGLNQVVIPYKYLSSLCISQGGNFLTVSTKLSPYIGTFECSKNTNNWSIVIENTKTVGDQIFLRTDIASPTHVAILKSYEKDKQSEQQKLIQQQRQQQLLKNKQYQEHIIKNSPKSNDVGITICKESELSQYNGVVVLGIPSFRKQNGTVIASFEGFSSDSKNLKINIKGFLNTSNGVSSGSDVFYKQTPLESGRVIWDDKQGWFKCNY